MSTEAPLPQPPAAANGKLGNLLHAVKELGVSNVLYVIERLGLAGAAVGFVFFQLPAMQADFRTQTDALVKAVNQSNDTMDELRREIRAARQSTQPLRQ